MKPVLTAGAPRPVGHYSQAVVHNNLVYVSGQLPIDPATNQRRDGSIEEQTEQVLRNLEEILKASGSSLGQVLKATVYVSDISLWDRVNAVYSIVFGEHRPARSIVPTRNLHHGALVEIDAIAAVEES